MKKQILIFFLILIVQFDILFAGTNLNLYYQFQDNINKKDTHRWDIDDPDHYLELKLYSNLIRTTETYFKLGVGGGTPSNSSWLSEANVKYRMTSKGEKYGSEIMYYYSQDRLWQSDHIINLVGDGQRWNIEGLRADFWAPNYFSGTVCLGDNKGDESTDDFNLYTVRHYIPNLQLNYNITYAQKRWGNAPNQYNWITGLFAQLKFGRNTYFSNELVKSGDPSQTPSSNSFAYKTELQWLRFNSENFGELGYKISAWLFGKNYRNYLANGGYENSGNERGYYNEIYYNLPKKAITLVLKDIYKQDGSGNKKDNEIYSEIYAELVKGYKFKTYYKYYVNAASQRYPELFWQFERDLDNIWYKFQYRIKDIGTTAKKNAIGLEASVKITPKLSMLSRFLTMSQPSTKRERESFYTQLKYDIGSSAELFAEYGAGWQGNDDLTKDGDFIDNDSNKTEHKVFMKLGVWF